MKIEKYNLPSGRSLGAHYQIIGQLGSGWEGEVYKVRENRTGIIRAAKLFYPRSRDREKPLLRYARKLYKLRSCPIVVQYHHRDTARVRGQTVDFLVSDFADGEMLSSFLARRKGNRLSSFEALHLLYALALGIEPVHFLGEYHGDIHSDNVMVKRRGLGFDVYLLDFFDLGRATKAKIQQDVFDLIGILYEMIGGKDGYARADDNIRKIIMGRKHSLIRRKFNVAGHLRLELENLEWE